MNKDIIKVDELALRRAWARTQEMDFSPISIYESRLLIIAYLQELPDKPSEA